MSASEASISGRSTELRIALVCYGGVSLAVYMHGITKELHKLVRASRAFDADPNSNPFPGSGSTEHQYFEMLAALDRDGRRLSVTIDIISGTSAGGINGVVLAKALAVDAEQEEAKRLWIDEGDLRKLLRTRAPGGLRTKALFAILRQLVHSTRPTSPLKGERMSQLLRDALEGMDASRRPGDRDGSAASTLLPGNGRLELFVTTTDLNGFELLVPSGIGGASQRDRYHAQVVQFDSLRGTDAEFGPAANPALAFAARATSSFPGAFAPVSAASFGQEAGIPTPDLEGGRLRFEYEEPGRSAQTAWFADGGILDNAPFDHVIDAVAARRAESEVLRKIIYIQPDPGRPLGVPPGPSRADPAATPPEEMGWLSGLVQVVGVKGSHPILRDLIKLRDMNLRIAQVGDIVTRQMSEMEKQIDVALATKGVLPAHVVLEAADASAPRWSAAAAEGLVANGPGQVQAAIDAVREHAAGTLAPTWATYQRLKVDAAGRRLADEISHALVYPRDSGRSSFVRAAIAAWARTQAVWTNPDPADLAELLRGADVPYRERRIMFILAGVNGLYHARGGPPRQSLDTLKQRAWQLLEGLRAVATRTIVEAPAELTAFLSGENLERWLFYDPSLFAQDEAISTAFRNLFFHYRDALAAETVVQDGGAAMWTFFETSTRDWRPEHRSNLLARYIGFPLWDAVIFPTVSLSELPQFTPIPVSQFSPLAASVLSREGGKLKGTGFHHFSGFFEAGWRENDYLWGRLDGVELILRSLRDTVRETPQRPTGSPGPLPPLPALAEAGGDLCIQALRAVLDSEHDLESADVRRLIADVRSQLDRLQ